MLCGKITAPTHVAVPVHRVDAEHQRDRDAPRAGRQCGRVEAARQLQPLERCRTIIAIRTAIAAGENRAERITREIFRHNRADVGLDDLPDLFLETHFRQQFVNARFGRRIDQAPAVRLGPVCGCTPSASVTGAALTAEPKIAAEAHTALNHRRLLSLIMKLS